MSPRCPSVPGTLTPFLYPFLITTSLRPLPTLVQRCLKSQPRRYQSSVSELPTHEDTENEVSHLNPPPSDYSRSVFADRATVTLHAGSGGHGCISFLREKYIAAGPANGGDGGYGGNVYIQAVRGETSLHKLARRSIMKAGRGKNGQGKTRGGERGDDIIVQVPVGTVVREIDRVDPVAIEEERKAIEAGSYDGEEDPANRPHKWSRDKWLLYPAITPEDIATAEFPALPKARRSHLFMAQPQAPINLDLSRPMEKPVLLAAGAVGGMGNPHFCTREVPRPKYATKGEEGMRITLSLELKLLADVGLVGLPNAGKSTLLRAMSNSRARVGDWAFTTLQPNIGTVVLDDNRGRPVVPSLEPDGEPRTNFTIADIPGLVQDAHLDRGLGISFLRHVERARVLAFVIDLGAGDAVAALKALWKEVGEYERMKVQEEVEAKDLLVEWSPFKSVEEAQNNSPETIIVPSSNGNHGMQVFPDAPQTTSIAGKPWFVVATKADLNGTKENFEALKEYLKVVSEGGEIHPSGQENGWCKTLEAIPVSAINGHGVERIREWTVGLLDE
jgi:GTP-binding protein